MIGPALYYAANKSTTNWWIKESFGFGFSEKLKQTAENEELLAKFIRKHGGKVGFLTTYYQRKDSINAACRVRMG
jgi:hypothetical protein